MEECIFCKIVKGEIPSYKVFENEKVIAILDINPANKGHILVIPKNHSENIFDIKEEDIIETIKVVKKLSAIFEEYDGLNILQNNKEQAGQVVKHFHIHLIPREKGDETRVIFKWIPKRLSQQDFEEISEELKKIINLL
ncbi:MAG TPA: HIT family protein [Nautiliaceae bacterium]|nr:HIT family protein [Nautiliaceae bacterium]